MEISKKELQRCHMSERLLRVILPFFLGLGLNILLQRFVLKNEFVKFSKTNE
jgi:hypothetical protein